jgi:DNA-binding XRE family transcriptional regulator
VAVAERQYERVVQRDLPAGVAALGWPETATHDAAADLDVRTGGIQVKLTQDEVARELGVTHQHVSRIESDQAAPSLDLLVKLSHRLGVSTDYLLTGQDTATADITGAIRGEPRLSPAAKRHLIGLISELRGAS